jgi:hypothetical protein
VALEFDVAGQFAFDPGQCRVYFKIDDGLAWDKEFKWENNKKFRYEFEQVWPEGDRKMALEIYPLVPPEQKLTTLDLRLVSVRVDGPLEEEHWDRPKNFDRFFSRDVLRV